MLCIASLDAWAIKMDVQRSLIGELIPYEFEMGYKSTEATKNICCAMV